MDNAKYEAYRQTEKWKQIARKRMEIDGFTCAMCGSRGTTGNVLEVHHISYRYLYQEEKRIYEDLVTLCHCCHKQTHALMERVTNADGRHGWKDRSDIPKISVFSLDNKTLENKEVQG